MEDPRLIIVWKLNYGVARITTDSVLPLNLFNYTRYSELV